MKFHEIIESAKTVTERGILDTLFISYHKMIKGKQGSHRVHKEVPVARDLAHSIWKESNVQDARKRTKWCDIMPFAYFIIVKVQEP